MAAATSTATAIAPATDPTLETLRQERDRFVAFAFAGADILLELDRDGIIRFADGAVSALLGRRAADLHGMSFMELAARPEDRNVLTDLLADARLYTRIEQIAVRLIGGGPLGMAFLIWGYQLPSLDERYFLALAADRAQFPAAATVKRDVRSGLLHRDSFAHLAQERAREAEAAGEQVDVTVVDLPDLKGLIDQLTPEQARNLLEDIAGHLRTRSVSGDSAALIGEGVYSLLHDDSVSAEQVREELLAITRQYDPRGVGAALHTQTIAMNTHGLNPQEAGKALLYTINRFASEDMENFSITSLSESYQHLLGDTLDRVSNFKATVDGNAFQLAFQPIVDLHSRKVHHYEALVRFDDTSTFSNPFQFITFGEQAGLIGDFDLAMCQRTLEALDNARHAGKRPHVSVNLSGLTLSSQLYMDALEKIMESHAAIRKQVLFEVTESSKIKDLGVANDFLARMRAKGNLSCLDDFGVGESSFDYLRNLQVDFVKIDGSYVKESLKTVRGRQLLKALASLCRDLDIVTIGEMVEDENVAKFLLECGVRFGQGYHFGKPTLDQSTLITTAEVTPFHHGTLRGRRLSDTQKRMWSRKGG